MEMLQHGLVTLVAFGAAAFVFRRVFTTFKPTNTTPRCGSCQTGGARTTGARATTTGLIQIMTSGSARERPRSAIRRSTHART